MPLIEWNESLSVGVKIIDEQHRKYVAALNLLHDAVQQNKDADVVEHVLNELQQYVTVHFNTEERFMKMYNYPDIEKHKSEHLEAIRQVNRFKLEYERKEQDFAINLLKFMTDLFLNHILKVDRNYIPYVQGKI